jgi:ferrochelatase
MQKKTGILLVNLGTPDSPSDGDVFKYLNEFLTDGRVIDYPWLSRQLLVRGIIVPARYKHSAKTYREVWDAQRGSPLKFHTEDLAKKVQAQLGYAYVVEAAMRYQHPSIESALEKFRKLQVNKIVVLPLFPQYSSACNGSVIEKVQGITSKWLTIPDLHFIHDFYDDPKFINAFVSKGRQYNFDDYDHILFSYHGLPARHLKKADLHGHHCLQKADCCARISEINQHCYRAQCFETTRLINEQLKIPADKFSVTFQSRLGKEVWLEPYTVEVIPELARKGKKKLLVFSPAFVADCLETLYEIRTEYLELYQKFGGESIQLIESLNSSDEWVDAVCGLVR